MPTLKSLTEIPRNPFTLWRIALGVFLFLCQWINGPFLDEMLGPRGAGPRTVELLAGQYYSDWHRAIVEAVSNSNLQAFHWIYLVLSLVLLSGFAIPIVCIVLFGMRHAMSLTDPFIASPEYAFVNWALIGLAISPLGPRKFERHRKNIDYVLAVGAWLALGFGYLLAAWGKLTSRSWQIGEGLKDVIWLSSTPRVFFFDFLTTIPDWFLSVLSYAAVLSQLLFLPMIFVRKTRWIAWSSLLLMHFVCMIFLDITEISMGMILFHGYVWLISRNFDPLFEKRTDVIANG